MSNFCEHLKRLEKFLKEERISIYSEHGEDGWVNVSCEICNKLEEVTLYNKYSGKIRLKEADCSDFKEYEDDKSFSENLERLRKFRTDWNRQVLDSIERIFCYGDLVFIKEEINEG